jgi:ABC-2 type transport system ATP-binding protein
MLTINILTKKYSDEIILENALIKIDDFGLYGLIGKNGQGKTTLFKCALGLENYSGQCSFNNSNIELHDVAWSPAEPPIYGELTASEFYEFYRNLLNLDGEIVAPLFEVPKNKLIRELSTGMKKKVYFNAIFQKKYNAYFLDEPFNGLDLEANHVLMQYLIEKSKESIVLISSHIIDLLLNNCQKIYVIKNKNLVQFDKESFANIHKIIFEI